MSKLRSVGQIGAEPGGLLIGAGMCRVELGLKPSTSA
jgi:hypothetical protein